MAYVHCLGQCYCLPAHLGMGLLPCFDMLDRAKEVDRGQVKPTTERPTTSAITHSRTSGGTAWAT